MATKYEKTSEKGVYRYYQKERFQGKPDETFCFSFKADGKKYWPTVGRKSEGIKVAYAAAKRERFMAFLRAGVVKPEDCYGEWDTPENHALYAAKMTDGKATVTLAPAAKAPEPTPVQLIVNPAPQEVNQALLAGESEAQRGITYGQAFEVFKAKWFSNLEEKSSQKDMLKRYKVHLEKRFSTRRIADIESLELETFKSELLQDRAAATVTLILGDMRNVINKMIRWGYYKRQNPLLTVEFPKVDNAKNAFINPDQAMELLARLKKRSLKWYGIAYISLLTGARLSEVLTLRVQDVDLAHGFIKVNGKTGRRTVAIKKMAVDVLEEAISLRKNIVLFKQRETNTKEVKFIAEKTGLTPTWVCRLYWADVDLERGIIHNRKTGGKHIIKHPEVRRMFKERIGRVENPYIWPSRTGKQIWNSGASKSFMQTVQECGINAPGVEFSEKVTFHSLRHTFCSWLTMGGTPLSVVSQAVGHKSEAMTKRYSHLSPETKDKTASMIEEQLLQTEAAISPPLEYQKAI